MNKLGFYTKNFGAEGVIEAIQNVKPPVLLTEMDDKGVLRRMRNEWQVDTFVVGRFFFPPQQQDHILDNEDPVQFGNKLAERCLEEDFQFGRQRGENGRLFVDAWMTLNEAVRGPNSFPPDYDQNAADYQEMVRRAAAYDTLQVAFRDRLKAELPDVEAVAFNFAAGNWVNGEDYVKHFPKTLEAYTYLGFHEYGWPHMNPNQPGTRSGCGLYRQVLAVLRRDYGDKHRIIITEAGLARMYTHPQDPAGDVGWLYKADPVSEESYKDSLRWYNQLLAQDHPFTVGACLYQVGPGGDWVTFRHTGLDNQGRKLSLMSLLEELTREPAPVPVTVPATPAAAAAAGVELAEAAEAAEAAEVAEVTEVTEAEPPSQAELARAIRAAGERLIIPLNREATFYKLAQERGFGDRLTGEYDVVVAGQAFLGQIFEGGLIYAPVGQGDLATAVPNSALAATARVAPAVEPQAEIVAAEVQPAVEVAAEAEAALPPSAPPLPDFAQVVGHQFFLKGKPSRFIGVNIRGLVHYGHDPDYFPHAPTAQKLQQLQAAVDMNARVVRLFLAHKDATPEQVEARLREVLALIKANFSDIYLLPALTNLYNDVPFYVRGDDGFFTPHLNNDFFAGGYRDNYLPFVEYIVKAFKNEPCIFAWEIGNELKAEEAPDLLVDFMTDVAAQIKAWDPNHLVTTGMISTRHAFMAGREELRQRLYRSPHLDFITNHAYNGNEPPAPVEDDSDLAQLLGKPLIIEEAGFDRNRYPNRPEKTRADMAKWFGQGASCYMPWGFVATDFDNNDGDVNVGMTGPIHADFAHLYELHKKCGQLLLERPTTESIPDSIAVIDFAPRRALPEELPWPLLADGFDFPVGPPDGLGYYVAAALADQDYYNRLGFWHTGEDWTSRDGGDSDLGAPVFTVAHGRVVTSQQFPTWGNIVLIEHRLPWGQIVWSQYAHLKDRYVRKGDVVRRGDQIGTIGKGDKDRFTAHLHLEIRLKNLPASKWGWTRPEDRARVMQAYVHPTNFINANRPK